MWRRRFATIAAKHPSLKFAIADEEKNSDLFKQFGFDESSEHAAMVLWIFIASNFMSKNFNFSFFRLYLGFLHHN